MGFQKKWLSLSVVFSLIFQNATPLYAMIDNGKEEEEPRPKSHLSAKEANNNDASLQDMEGSSSTVVNILGNSQSDPGDPQKTLNQKVLKLCLTARDFTEETTDIYRIYNILSLLINLENISPLHLLQNISRQIDAMSVYKRFLRDRFALALPWQLLAYMSHGLSLPELSEPIRKRIINAISLELPQLQTCLIKILDLEERKFDLLNKQRKLPYTIERNSRPNPKPILNTPLYARISEIQRNGLLTHEKRYALTKKIAEEIVENSGRSDLSTLLKKKQQKIIDLETELENEKKQLAKVSFRSTEGALEFLYELESLQIASKHMDGVLTIAVNQATLPAIMQGIIILGEGINNISVASSLLKIPEEKDILSYRALMKYLRNTLEHPFDHQKEKLKGLRNSVLSSPFFKAVLEELGKLNAFIKLRVDSLKNMLGTEQIFSDFIREFTTQLSLPFPQEDTQTPSNPKQYRLLLKKPHWDKNTDTPYLQRLRRYLIHPSYQIEDLNENLEEQAKKVLQEEAKQPKPKEVQAAPIPVIVEEIENLEKFLKSKPVPLIKILENSISDRITLYNYLSNIFRYIDRHLEEASFLSLLEKKHQSKNFYYNFQDVRERRNFNTHDLWRTDIKGTVNTAWRLVHTIRPILKSLISKSAQPLSPFEQELLSGTQNNTLSSNQIEVLVKGCGADVNKVDNNFRSALHYTVLGGNKKATETLLQLGARVNDPGKRGERPLYYVTHSDDLDMAKLLISYGALPDIKSDSGTTLFETAASGNKEIAAYLRTQSGLFRGQDADSLHTAVELLDVTELTDLIKNGYALNTVNGDGRLPLAVAISQESMNEEGEYQVIKTLVDSGADANRLDIGTSNYPLHIAAEYTSDVRVFDLILKKSNDELINNQENGCGFTPLHHTILVHRPLFCQKLLERGANVHLRDDIVGSAILEAANAKFVPSEIFELLLKHGANPNDESEFGSVLHHLADTGKRESVRFLLDNGANPWKKGKSGNYYEKLPFQCTEDKEVKKMLREFMKAHPPSKLS